MTENNRLHNGQFAPGNPGKPKGSSKNKMRDEIRTFISIQWESFPNWFSELTPKEKIETMLALLPYSVSRLQSVSITDTEGNELEPRAIVDYTLLSPEALKEVLSLTTIADERDL